MFLWPSVFLSSYSLSLCVFLSRTYFFSSTCSHLMDPLKSCGRRFEHTCLSSVLTFWNLHMNNKCCISHILACSRERFFCHPLPFLWPLTLEDLGFQIYFTFELFIYCTLQGLIHIVFAIYDCSLFLLCSSLQVWWKVWAQKLRAQPFFFIQYLDAHRNIYTKLVLVIIA